MRLSPAFSCTLAASMLLVQSRAAPGLVEAPRHVPLASPPTTFTNCLSVGRELLVPDLAGGHILVFDMESGERTATRGKLGGLPGELTSPVALVRTPDGFAVMDLKRHRVVRFNRMWEFLSEMPSARPPGDACFFYGPALWLGSALVGNGVVSAELCGGQERVYLFSLSANCAVTPLLWHDGTRDWSEVTFVSGEGGLEDLLGGGWVYVEPSRFEFTVFDGSNRMTRRFQGERANWTEADYDTRPVPGDRKALVAWLDRLAFVYRPVALDATHVAVVVQPRPAGDKVKRYLEVYDVTTGQLEHREELSLPSEQGRLLVVARAEPRRLVVLLRANRDPGAATEVWDFRIDWPPGAPGVNGVPARTPTAATERH